MDPWRQFWAQDNRVYVTGRYRQLHYQRLAADVLPLLPGDAGRLVMLDYGCGDALGSATLAERIGTLYLYDSSAQVQGRLRERFAARPGIMVIDAAGVARLDSRSVDLILIYSVVQYLTRADFLALLAQCRMWLRPGGVLLLGDVVPPAVGPLADAASLLRTAARHQFLAAALAGLIAQLFSGYRSVRARAPLAQYGEAEVLGLLSAAGFHAERRAANLGLNQRRMTFVARMPS